jgi:hypothetical protein
VKGVVELEVFNWFYCFTGQQLGLITISKLLDCFMGKSIE